MRTLAFAFLVVPFLAGIAPAEDVDARLDSGPMNRGDTYAFTFDAVGAFDYYCRPHPFMKARVIVEEGADTAPVHVAIANHAYRPDVTIVGVGTRVEWVNEDDVFHTVTAAQEAAEQSAWPWLVLIGSGVAVAAASLGLLAWRGRRGPPPRS